MKRIFFAVIAVATSFSFLSVAGAQSAQFSRTLKIGDSGEDVILLQKMLNKDPRTAVAVSGVGSPGYETRTFGGLTKNAVIKFQELYKNEILAPVGLTRGTGFVGQGTLKKLAGMGVGSSGLAISGISPSRALPGSTVTMHGAGFTDTSTVLFDGTPVPTTRTGAGILRFNVPSAATGGLHPVSVRSDAGVVSNVLMMLIDAPGASKPGTPVITSVTPSRGGLGTTVVITGAGFATSSTNTIYTGYEKIANVVSPDGKTLSFSIPSYLAQFDFSKADFTGVGEATLPFGIAVENANGMSEFQLFTFVIH